MATKPRCYVCKSEFVCWVQAGLVCLDCGFGDSRIVPKGQYEMNSEEEVDWSGVPRMVQMSVAEVISGLRMARDPKHKGREWMTFDPTPARGQIELFDREEFRITNPQRNLFGEISENLGD